MPDVAVLIPVLGRPERVAPLLESLARARNDASVAPVFLVNEGDRQQIRAVEAAGAAYTQVGPWAPGDYARKMNTGHADAGQAGVPWVFLAADDLCFCDGWADQALRVARRTGAKVVGTNDLGNPSVMRGQASTHTLVSTAYTGTVDNPAVLLHPGYHHNYVDVELVGTAQARRVWAFARGSLVEHLHPAWGKAADDNTYRLGMEGYHRDALLCNQRRRMWERERRKGRVRRSR